MKGHMSKVDNTWYDGLGGVPRKIGGCLVVNWQIQKLWMSGYQLRLVNFLNGGECNGGTITISICGLITLADLYIFPVSSIFVLDTLNT